MRLSINFDSRALTRHLDDVRQRQIPFATALALTRTAQRIKDAETKEIADRFDRPTPYTLSSIYMLPATKAKQQAKVWVKDDSFKGIPAVKFLGPQIYGGDRNLKRSERALQRIGVLPAGLFLAPGEAAPRDRHGNVPGSFIVQILSYFRAFGEQGYRANITDKRQARLAKGTKKTRGFTYFAVQTKTNGLAPGIYRRTQFAFGSAVQPMLMFVRKPSYRRAFPFFEVANRVTEAHLKDEFAAAMAQAMATARR